ncbi:beta strand repeat-containing protein [Paraclostridium dentum]|uniref:beta strand repeat-containing protein n=1 Tax=Paraclostridium dentum TaxID=2662455 RepID=UPI003F39D185
MAKLLASSQITIVDLNDAVSLQSYITSTHPRLQFLNNNGTYIPNFVNDSVTLNAELYKMGDKTNLVTTPGTEVSKVAWFVKIAPSQTYTEITPSMSEYELIGTAPYYRGVKIKKNIMNASKPGATFKAEVTFKENWMQDAHIQVTEIDFTLSMQGNDGADAYTPILTNANHSIICSSAGIPDTDEIGVNGRAYSDTIAYKGTSLLTAVASNPGAGQYSITIEGTNCTAVKKDADTFYIDTISTRNAVIGQDGLITEDGSTEGIIDSSLSAKNIPNGGKVKVTFNLEGQSTMVQEMSYSKVFHGTDGTDGTDGRDGESAKYLTLSLQEGSTVFKYEKDATTPNVSKAILKANVFNINSPTYAWSYYANGSWSTISGQTSSTLTVNATDAYFNASNSITFRCMTTGNLSDEMTISKLIDGSDAVTIQSSNESHVIACTNGGTFKPGESDRAVNSITAFKGATALTLTSDATVGKGKYKISVVANSAVTHSISGNTIKITNMTADSAVLLINVDCEGKVHQKTMSLSKAKDGREGVDGYVSTLTNEFHSLPANASGSVTSYAGCSTSIELYKGADLVTTGVTYAATANSGVTGTMAGNTYTVTGLSTDTSSVNLTATYNGKSYSKVFTITKNKQGNAGADGSDGQNANSYWILPSATSIHKDKNGVLNPSSLTFNSRVQSGENPLQDYSGRFKVYTSTNGSDFTLSYTSSADEYTTSVNVSNTIKAIKCELYLAGGTTTLLDIHTIFVTSDGSDGQNGQNAAYVTIAGEGVFKYGANFIGTPTPSAITLTRTLFNTTGGKWQYHNGSTWLDFSPSQTGATLQVTPTLGHFSTSSNKVMRVRFSINESLFDEMSIIKVADGAAGANAFTVVLDNESHTVAANTSGALLSGEAAKAKTNVIVYKGSDRVTNFTLAKVSDEGIVTNVDNTAKSITLTSMPDANMSGKTTVKITAEGQELNKVFSISKSKQANDGTPAKVVNVSASSQAFITSKTGATTPSGNITVTAELQGLSGNVTWTKSVNGGAFGSVTETVSGNTLTVTKSNVSAGNTVTYKATNGSYSDSVSITHIREGNDGNDAYTVVMTNESHTLAAANNGSVTTAELDKTLTQILVYKGATAITDFTLTTEAVTGCTVSTPTSDKKLKLTAMSADTASYTAVIVVGGQTLKKVFSATKSRKPNDGAEAVILDLTASNQTFVTSKSGSVAPAQITLTGEIRGAIGTTTYSWKKSTNGGAWGDISGTTNTRTVEPANVTVGQSCAYKLIAVNSGKTYEDTITLVHIREGADGTNAYTVVLSNPSHTVVADENGNVSSAELAKAVTEVIVYKGSSTIQPTLSGGVANPTSTAFSVTAATASVPAKITMTTFPNSVDSATYTVNVAVGDGQTVKQTFTVTKAKKGVQGSAAKAVNINGDQFFKYLQGSSTPTNGASITLSATETNFTGTDRKWYANGAVISGQTTTNLTVAHDASYWAGKTSLVIRYTANGVSDEISLAKLYDGNDAYTVILDNESHSIVCNSNGDAISGELGSGGKAKTKVKVYKGSTELTASNTAAAGKFRITTAGTMADGSGTCSYIVENSTNVGVYIATAIKDSGIVPITIDVDGGRATITKNFTFTKTKTGSAAKAIQISGGSTIVFKADGSKDPSAGVRLEVAKKNVSGTIVWKNGSTQLATGDSYTVPTSVLNSANSYTVRAEVQGDTSVYDTHTIHKIIDGTNAVTSYIWCPNGNAIKNDNMSSVQIDAVIFDGASNITTSAEATYHWEKKVGSNWVSLKGTASAPIAGSNGGSTVTVNQADIPSMLVVRCTMKYKAVTQIDSIVIEDIMDPVQATIFSTAGDTFKNGMGETFLIAKAIRNGAEIDPIRLVENKTGITGYQGEVIFDKSDKKYYKYNNNAWVEAGTLTAPPTDLEFDYI